MIPRLTVANSSVYDLDIEVTGANRDGWTGVGTAKAHSTKEFNDVIDHGKRSHVTLRHVGFRTAAQLELHEAVWAYWFERLRKAAEHLPREAASSALGGAGHQGRSGR